MSGGIEIGGMEGMSGIEIEIEEMLVIEEMVIVIDVIIETKVGIYRR